MINAARERSAARLDPAVGPQTLGDENEPIRLLIVDDIEDNRIIIGRRFVRRGFRVAEANCGRQALEYIERHEFDVVLLDVNMPEMDGMEVLRKIREMRSMDALPVIMCTANHAGENVVRALEAGANDYVTKPVDLSVALARIRAQVERKRANAKLARAQAALSAMNEDLERRVEERTRELAAINHRLELEILRRQQSDAKTQYLVCHDALTGLPNRTLLDDRLSQALKHAEGNDRWLTVLFVDLDNFKLVNENLGHNAGDEILKAVAKRLVDNVRATDTVVRHGGDEFVVLLLGQPKSPDLVAATVQNLRAAIAIPVRANGHDFKVTSSIGIANYPDDGTDAKTLLANADAAMYRAKETGRDSFQFFTPDLNTKAHNQFLLYEELQNAVVRSEFVLLYQPQVDLRTGRIFAVEALIRWQHPTLGMISPIKFIAMAEETGLIIPIGDWVLHEACRQNKAWQDAGLPPIVVSVNVSARQFIEKSLLSRVVDALQQSGLEAKFMELELTESLIVQDVKLGVATMEELRRLGVGLSIDDFGTGYSSLSALKTFPVERLKIDKSFVDGLPAETSDRAVARAVISLGHELKMRVIAEGVESEAQAQFLRENDCDEMQGYLFSRPVRAQRIEELLSATPG